MKTIITLVNVFTFPGFKEIWSNLGYYFAVSVAFIIVFGLIESVLLYMFDTTGESRGVIGLLLDLIEAIFYWIGEKIADIYYDIVFALSKK